MSRLSNVPTYLNLSLAGGSRARLCILKNAAAYTNAPDVHLPSSKRFADWRAAREVKFTETGPALSQGFNVETRWAWGKSTEVRTPVWSAFCGDHFRNEKYADDVDGGPTHTGWFADADCSNTVRGIVGRLSHDRFVAGYVVKDNGEHVYLCRVFDDEREAARAADQEAERIAEKEKEYSERWQAAHEQHDKAQQEEKEVARLFALRNHPTLGEDARADLDDHIAELRALRESLKHQYADIEF